MCIQTILIHIFDHFCTELSTVCIDMCIQNYTFQNKMILFIGDAQKWERRRTIFNLLFALAAAGIQFSEPRGGKFVSRGCL